MENQAKIKKLEDELKSGMDTLKGLVDRKADATLFSHQIFIIKGTLDDLIKTITGEEYKVEP